MYGNILSKASKKQGNEKVALNNGILGVHHKMIINMLMKHYTLLYNTFISLLDLYLVRLAELSTSQPKL